MVDTSTQVRTAMGNVTRALCNLLLKVEVDGKSELIVFRAISELEQELILGIDFCRLFDVDTRLGRGVWRVHDGEWHSFDHKDGAGNMRAHVFAECVGPCCYEPSDLGRLGLVPIVLPPNVGAYLAEMHVQHGRPVYNIGDLVFWKARHSDRYLGPFRVVQVRSPTMYIIRDSHRECAAFVTDLRPHRPLHEG